MLTDGTFDVDYVFLLRIAKKTATATSATFDRQVTGKGFNSVDFIVWFGVPVETIDGSNYWTITMQDSDNDSSYSVVDTSAKGLIDPGAKAGVNLITGASVTDKVYHFGYVGTRRYVQIVITATGTHTTGTEIGVAAARSNPYTPPTPSAGA